MSQILAIFPALSSPVKVTDAATLSANMAAIDNLDNREVIGFSVVALIHELNSKGGTDYRTNHKQLRIDATSLMGVFPIEGLCLDRFAKFRAVIEWNTAFGLDAALTTSVATILAEEAGLRETPESTLLKFYYFLRYKLSLLGI